MITLPNGCSCSEISVSPKNWQSKSASTKKPWRIYYRFYDPLSPDGKPHYEEIKSGINFFKDLQERRAATKALLEQEKFKLKEQGFNPRTKTYDSPLFIDYEIDPETPFLKALEQAKDKLTVSHEVKIDMKSALKTIGKAAADLRLAILPINKVSIRHLTMLMDRCAIINKKWSARRHNMYRAYLIMMFKKLVKLEAVTGNPAINIDIAKQFKKLKQILTTDQRQRISDHLKEHNYRFWCFINLYFHSGARMPEILQQKASTVDLNRGKYRCIIKKGKEFREVERTIKDVAIPYWKEFLDGAGDNFLFSVDFKPGSKPMCQDTPGRWWNRLVKKELKINVDLYSLKHLNTDQLTATLGAKDAAKLNEHSEQMALTVYAVGEAERQHERIRKVANEF